MEHTLVGWLAAPGDCRVLSPVVTVGLACSICVARRLFVLHDGFYGYDAGRRLSPGFHPSGTSTSDPLPPQPDRILSGRMDDLRVSFPAPCRQHWEDMRPVGCNRFCAACSKTIYDLSELTAEEAEALLKEPQKPCVRAQVSRDGSVVLKSSSTVHARKMMVAVTASIGLFTSACETVPQRTAPTGVIAGKVDPKSGVKSVRAVSDSGRTYKAKVLDDGSYRFKPLPYGSYSLKFVSECGSWNGERVVLRESERSAGEPPETQTCIIVGMLKIEDSHG